MYNLFIFQCIQLFKHLDLSLLEIKVLKFIPFQKQKSLKMFQNKIFLKSHNKSNRFERDYIYKILSNINLSFPESIPGRGRFYGIDYKCEFSTRQIKAISQFNL